MKSLLVDALRQANENSDEPKLDDSARLEHTTIEEASNDSMEEVELDAAELAIADDEAPHQELELADDPAVDDSTDAIVATDADFDDAPVEIDEEPGRATGMLRRGRRAQMAMATNDRQGPATLLERFAPWAPVVCLGACAVAIAAFSGWNSAAGSGHNTDLRALIEQGRGDFAAGADGATETATRFPFVESMPLPRQTAAPAIASATQDALPPPIVVERSPYRARMSAGTTNVDATTFGSLGTAYGAYAAGEIGRSQIDEILATSVRSRGTAIETEIKLLLQRYPDAAPLHYALGTLLAQASRWPEAKIAFARAAELAASADGRNEQ